MNPCTEELTKALSPHGGSLHTEFPNFIQFIRGPKALPYKTAHDLAVLAGFRVYTSTRPDPFILHIYLP